MIVEGVDELNLAIDSGLIPQTLLTAPELATRTINQIRAETLTLTRVVFEKISYRENPDGWLGVFQLPKTEINQIKLSRSPLIIVAESVEKPGNLGAILRTADAAHIDALLVCDPRVDLYNPNVIRASRGAIFSVPCVEISNPQALSYLREHDMMILAATPQADVFYTDVNMNGPTAITVGTEDKGLTTFWMEQADVKVKIPMLGRVNSLNVSIATALIVYEAVNSRLR